MPATVLVTGNTFPVKDQIKALGGRWDATAKGWRVPEDKAAEAQALVAGAPASRPSVASTTPGKCNKCGRACKPQYSTCYTCSTGRSSTRRARGARYCEGWGADNPHAPRPPYTCTECGYD